ncbi:MAG: ABC transporter permease [Candidatus Cloacimonetes bacterium]|nr:ABC transporter permease [Candidatus Cloacimonadota bacterium]
MIAQMFRMIWNRRGKNFMTFLGIMISFVVLYIVAAIVIYNFKNFFKPLGFDYKDVWYVTSHWENHPFQELKTTLEKLDSNLRNYEEIIHFSYSKSFIFMPSAISTTGVKFAGNRFTCSQNIAGDDFDKVLNIEVLEGRWFSAEDNAMTREPLVINIHTRKALFGDGQAVGQKVIISDSEFEVVGVIGEFRSGGQFSGSRQIIFQRTSLTNDNELARFLGEYFGSRILLKVKPGTDAQFEQRLIKDLSRIAPDWRIDVRPLEEIKKSANIQTLILPIILAVICTFLMVNIALGLFGVIWYNTDRRKSEIGLRRSIGASQRRIYQLIIGEALFLSFLSLIAGSFFVVQFPVLNIIPYFTAEIYIAAYVVSVLLIIAMTVLCAYYPSRRAIRIEPALALHEE